MSSPTPSRIFISYRRDDASSAAGRLHDQLAAHFGAGQIFMDVDSIGLGVDFLQVIERTVNACEVLLAVIGPHWLTATDSEGHRRLNNPDDVVRREIEAALNRNILVVPILVESARIPLLSELPLGLESLAHRNGLVVRHESFTEDVRRLIEELERVLNSTESKPAGRIAPGRLRIVVDESEWKKLQRRAGRLGELKNNFG